jgi:hypothetical protein
MAVRCRVNSGNDFVIGSVYYLTTLLINDEFEEVIGVIPGSIDDHLSVYTFKCLLSYLTQNDPGFERLSIF